MKSVIICDMEGVIQEINKGALELFGYNKDELIGKKRVSIFSPGEIVIQNVLGWLEKANKEGKSLIKTNFIKKDGSQFNAEILITPNFANGKDQEQTGYCGITKEIKEEVNIPINFTTKIFKGIAITRGGFTLASILPMVIVAVLLNQMNSLSIINAIISIIGIISVHIFGNLYNDYFDVKSGTDEVNNEYFNVGDKSLILRGAQISGGSRAIELGLITLKKTKNLGNIMLLIASLCIIFLSINIYLETKSFKNILGIIVIGFLGSFLAYFYTAKPLRLSARKGLGEIVIFLTFGPLLTLGSLFAMSNTPLDIAFYILKDFILIGIPLGLLTTNILFINQFPDYQSDKKSDKINLVVLFGKKFSRWIYLLNLMLIFFSTFYFIKEIHRFVPQFNNNIFYISFSIIFLYGLYIFSGLFKYYDSRKLINYNIQTIYYQIIFCIGLILTFYI
ncbi:MAG: UbiA family prenyltransferase [Flavobacteriaceae bacterium]